MFGRMRAIFFGIPNHISDSGGHRTRERVQTGQAHLTPPSVRTLYLRLARSVLSEPDDATCAALIDVHNLFNLTI